MNIEDRYISYAEVSGGFTVEHDDYGLVAYLTETRKKALFSNPNLTDYSQALLNLKLVDGVVAARSMSFLTKIKVGEEIQTALSGSTLDVPEEYRHLGLGADLMFHYAKETQYDYNLSSGISEIALPLYKVLKFKILEFPRMMFLCNARPIIESKGVHGILLSMVAGIANILLRLFRTILKQRSVRSHKKFDVRKETVVPEWVDEMVLNDGHKYTEVHDHLWLQWNLDYNFKDDKEDIQSFYSVYYDNKPVGFFMTKERFRQEASNLKKIILGAVVEWGVARDCDLLDESLLYKMAFSTFSPKTDIIELATDNENVCKKMKKWGFIKHGFAHIAFKDRHKNCADAKDINLWRVRYGYADVILT